MRIADKMILVITLIFCGYANAAVFDIDKEAYISCTSDEYAELIKIGEYEGDNPADKLRAEFFKWSFDKIKKETNLRIDFEWKPNASNGPRIKIITGDSPYHYLEVVRTKTKNSLIAVSSMSGVNTAIGWLFTFNFNLKTMIAAQISSGVANVRGEVMTFQCVFENLGGQGDLGGLTPIEAKIE